MPGTSLVVRTLALIVLSGLLPMSAHAQAPRPSGRVSIKQTQIAFIGSATMGGGTLSYGGKSYPFSISGLGVGGTGASKMEARGEVYNLRSARDFEGVYGQARVGWALGNKGGGQTWLENDKGVV